MLLLQKSEAPVLVELEGSRGAVKLTCRAISPAERDLAHSTVKAKLGKAADAEEVARSYGLAHIDGGVLQTAARTPGADLTVFLAIEIGEMAIQAWEGPSVPTGELEDDGETPVYGPADLSRGNIAQLMNEWAVDGASFAELFLAKLGGHRVLQQARAKKPSSSAHAGDGAGESSIAASAAPAATPAPSVSEPSPASSAPT